MKVFVWLPKGTQVGHASLLLSNGTYLSLWPDEEKKAKNAVAMKKGSTSSSLDEDVHNEGRRPDRIFDLSGKGYNEKAIEKWWDEFKYTKTYELLNKNCCWVVYTALTKGGAPGKSESLWTPSKIEAYVSGL